MSTEANAGTAPPPSESLLATPMWMVCGTDRQYTPVAGEPPGVSVTPPFCCVIEPVEVISAQATALPGAPGVPGVPLVPVAPVAPVAPLGPVGPIGPAGPFSPFEP